MPKVRVFVADDHQVVREGLKRLIERQPDMDVVGESADGAEAIEQTLKLNPDVVIMDVAMSPTNGAAATRELRRRGAIAKVLALTVHEDRGYMQEMIEAGAAGYVLKRAAADELVNAIRAIVIHGVYLDPRIAGKIIADIGPPSAIAPSANGLSERETQIMQLIARGYTNKEIGAKLGISTKTVETHKSRSMEKLGLRSRVDIVRLAALRGWLSSWAEADTASS